MNLNSYAAWRSINFFKQYRDPLLVTVLLLLPLVFYVSNSKNVRDHNVLDRAVGTVSAPIQWLIVTSIDAVCDVWNHYVNLMHLQELNTQLRLDNDKLQAALAEREEQAHENARLRLLVGLRKSAPDVQMLFAQTIATSPSPLFRSIRIDRGTRDGVAVGHAVVTHAGVVGRVAAVGETFADVMLLTDSNSSIDILVQRTRARARVRGQGGDHHFGLDVEYLARTADVEPGDILITSGLGRVFPKGLVVGEVASVERRAFGLYQQALVQPSVDFSRIESVMVVLPGFAATTTFEGPLEQDPEPNADTAASAIETIDVSDEGVSVPVGE